MLRDIRLAKKLTQKQLSEAAGLTQGYISQIELGSKTPNMKVARNIASVLGVTLDELINAIPATK
jgi:transcriptional regulator with XRE-family HTH domain